MVQTKDQKWKVLWSSENESEMLIACQGVTPTPGTGAGGREGKGFPYSPWNWSVPFCSPPWKKWCVQTKPWQLPLLQVEFKVEKLKWKDAVGGAGENTVTVSDMVATFFFFLIIPLEELK